MRRWWLLEVVAVVSAINSSSPCSSEETSILCTGDVLLAGGVLGVMREKGAQSPWEGTAELLSSADIAICNLEAPFGRDGEPWAKKFTFITPPQYVGGLSQAGFDLVSLANNHIMDYGVGALKTTLSLLNEQGIGFSGAGLDVEGARRPAVIEKKGLKVGFLSYSKTFPTGFYAGRRRPGTAPGYEGYLKEDIPRVKEEVDFLIVAFHWGGEWSSEPRPYQTYLGRMAVDLGADLVVGHHPHVFQGIEVYKSAIIAYSLGNFVFGSLSKRAKGVLLRVKVREKAIAEAEVLPLRVRNDVAGYQPAILKGREAEVEIDEIRQLSLPFGTEILLKGDVGLIQLP